MTGKRVRPEDEQLGASIHQLMWLKRIPQRELAGVLDVEQNSVSRRLRGKQPFTVGELFLVAALLEVEPAELVALAGPPAGLPRLDSNQQPFANRFALLRGGAAAPSASVVDLAAYRAGRGSAA